MCRKELRAELEVATNPTCAENDTILSGVNCGYEFGYDPNHPFEELMGGVILEKNKKSKL